MKQFCGWVVFCFCLLLILFKMDSAFEMDRIKKEWEYTRAELERENEQLKQEIRIMKTDLYVFLNGYEKGLEE